MTPARPGPGPFTWDSPFVRALATQLVRLEHPRTAQGASFALLTVLDAETRADAPADPQDHLRYRLEMLAWLVQELDGAMRREIQNFRANPLYPTAPDALTHIRALAEALATITEHVDTLLATHTSTPHTSRAA